MGEHNYIVATECMTYNQVKFIEDTLNGFAIQETNFPIVFVVVDDASTDGEPDYLREWANRNLDDSIEWVEMPYGQLAEAPLKSKPLSKFVILLLNENHFQTGRNLEKRSYISKWLEESKYLAECEGDDYWIDSSKLQKQVDFMDSHLDYSMCHTDFNLSNGSKRNHYVYKQADDNFFPAIIQRGLQVGTLTAMYRSSSVSNIPRLYRGKGWPMGDLPLWIELAKEGRFKFMPIVTGRYRVTENSSSHGSLDKEIRFAEATVSIRQFYANYYGVVLPYDGYSRGYYVTILKCAFKHSNKLVARKYFMEAKKAHLTSLKLYVFYTATMIPILGKFFNTILKR